MKAHEEVERALANFRSNYPGPYLDQSRGGITYRLLSEAAAELKAMAE
jgi:hypothetical protein